MSSSDKRPLTPITSLDQFGLSQIDTQDIETVLPHLLFPYSARKASGSRPNHEVDAVSRPIETLDNPPATVAAPLNPVKGRNVFIIGGFCSIGGFLFGSDTGSIGPITVMPSFLDHFPQLDDKAAIGAIVATILMAASLASFAGGYLSDKFSRKRTIAVGGLIYSLGAALEAASVNLPMFIFGRLVAGVGEGFFLSSIGVYLVEISPPDVRGRVSSILQLLVTIGIASGYFICYGTATIASSLSWRIPFIVQSAVAMVFALGLALPNFIPYSPRWLLQQRRFEEAFQVMDSFNRGSSSEKEKEELLARAALETDDRQRRQATVVESFKDPYSRWRTIFGIFLLGMQQLSGIDGVLYYAPLLFAQAGLGSRQATFLASGVSGIVNVVCTLPAQYWLMDRWGRRSSTITGGLVMAACMACLGSLYASSGSLSKAGKWASVAIIYVFVAAFSLTWSVVIKLFITEIQPNRTRATASSLAQSANWLVNLAVALSTPIFLARSPSAPYFMWGACLLLTSLVCVIYMPETLGKSLQEIDTVWDARITSAKSIVRRLTLRGKKGPSGPRVPIEEIELANVH